MTKGGRNFKNGNPYSCSTRPNPFAYRPEWEMFASTKRGEDRTVLYLRILHKPESGVISLDNVSSKVTSANHFDYGEKVSFKQDGENISFALSTNSIETLDDVIKVMPDKPLK